jgi:hypothetical protein
VTDDDGHCLETGFGEFAQQQRDRARLDREQRQRSVGAGRSRPAITATAGSPRRSGAAETAERAVRPSPRRITRSSAQLRVARAAAAALVSGGPKRASASAAANCGRRHRLLAHEQPQLIGCRARTNVDLVDEEVYEFAPAAPAAVDRASDTEACGGRPSRHRSCLGDEAEGRAARSRRTAVVRAGPPAPAVQPTAPFAAGLELACAAFRLRPGQPAEREAASPALKPVDGRCSSQSATPPGVGSNASQP